MNSNDIVSLIYNSITALALIFCIYFIYTDLFKNRNNKKMMMLFALFSIFLLVIVVFSIDEEKEYQTYLRKNLKDENK